MGKPGRVGFALTISLMSLPASWHEARLHAAWAEGLGFASLGPETTCATPREPEHPFLDGWTPFPHRRL